MIRRLVEDEMESFDPEDYLSMLPPVPQIKLPKGSLLRGELERLEKNPSSHMQKPDMSRQVFASFSCLCRRRGL